RRPGRSAPPSPSSSPSPSPSPSASPAAADSTRTGTATDHRRHDDWDPVPEAVPEGGSHAAVPPHAAPSGIGWEPHGRAAETGVDRRVAVLTLGVGLTLMGLGLGFIGLRVRRA
ncbi:hypothetical protein ACE14D_27330, partial [Streptomyces sp. Act-28]